MPAKRGRHAKKSGGRATPKGTRPSGHAHPHVRAIFVDAAEVVHDDPADAESFASSFQQVFRLEKEPRPDDVLREAQRVGGLVGLFIAQSVKVFGPTDAQRRADSVFEKIAAKSAPPQWLLDMGNVTIREVVMLREPYGDGYGIYLEYDDPLSRDIRTIGVYIDVNMGLIAKDVIDGPPISEIRDLVKAEPHIEVVAIDPAEARARVEAAFAELDNEPELELLDDLQDLRALAEQRFSLLPAGGSVPDDAPELSDDEIDELIDAFVSSPYVFGLLNQVREVGEVICEFARDWRSNPLRWSPVVVEIFLTDWLRTEVGGDDEFFYAVPEVLRAWIRFAGERRGLDVELIDETVQSIDQWLDEYYEILRSVDPSLSAMFDAMLRDGIDLEDGQAVQAFVDEYRAGLSEVDVELDRAEESLLAQWREFEAQLVDQLKTSLDTLRGVDPPDTLANSATAVRTGIVVPGSPLATAADLNEWNEVDLEQLDDVTLLCAVATAWFEPTSEPSTVDDDDLADASAVDHTDLLRVVTSLVRQGPGAVATAERLAQLLDSPEDFALLLRVFERHVTTWQAIGAVDSARRLTPLGQWLLPRALARRWGGDFDAPN